MIARREWVWTYGYDGEQTGAIRNPLDLHIDDRLHRSETLYFTVRADDPKADLLADDLDLRWRGRKFYIVEPVKRRDGAAGLVEIEAIATWNRLADDKRVGTFELVSVDPLQGLAAILDGSGWSANVSADVNLATTAKLVATDASVLDLVRKWAKILTLEVEFDTLGQAVTLVEQVGANRGQSFRYRRNLVTVERRSSPPRCTKLWPFGRDDLSIVGLHGEPFLEDFTFYTAQGLTLDEARARFTREQVWKDRSFVADADLLAAAQSRLALLSQPEVNYRMTIVDLAELTGLPAGRVAIGDTVRAADDSLGFNVSTRVVRLDRYPLDPGRSIVELSYLPVAVPDPSVEDTRADLSEEWTLFASRNSTTRKVRNGTTVVNRLDLSTTAGAEWVVGYSLIGTAVGTGTATVTLLDAITGTELLPPLSIAVAAGEQIREAFTFGDLAVDAGQYGIIVRASSSGGGIGIDIDPEASNLWVLARGTLQQSVLAPNMARFDFTGTVQSFTVPDDVYALDVELVGAGGTIQNTATAGRGGKLSARLGVVPGTVLDVYVGGCNTTGGTGGWPNGGDALVSSGANVGGPGGGSSHIAIAGAAITDPLMVAPGGGGSGWPPPAQNTPAGGFGGFLEGEDGLHADVGTGGGGATQTAGGAAGTGGFAGTAGDAMQGGAGRNAFLLAYGGGGGGGGYFGGGGGAGSGSSSSGGGGGSGYATPEAFDLEPVDDFNPADNTLDTSAARNGWIVFRWADPTV